VRARREGRQTMPNDPKKIAESSDVQNLNDVIMDVVDRSVKPQADVHNVNDRSFTL
jgi:hypothetical protein